mgnify:CR=1 FL=1
MAKQKSRAERFSEAKDNILNSEGEVEELRDELQSWLDNLPENLQSSNKADMLQEAIDSLEEIIDALDTIDGIEIDFPTMYS